MPIVDRLDPDACYRALSARDPRFDGLFFVGVETTGIYCRPVCPAKTPGRSRCRFFTRPVDAERAGFRACFRCRPEVAPGSSPVDAVSRLAAVAVARIEAGFLDEASIDDLGASLGVSGRHLRRAMTRELGIGPLELAASRRLALAKQLLHDSGLPITEVAFVSGFSSLRRFNAAFLRRFGTAPSTVRRGGGEAQPGVVSLRLDARPPYDFEALLAFVGARAIDGVERVASGRYERTFRTRSGPAWLSVVRVQEREGSARAQPAIRLEVHGPARRDLSLVVSRVRRLFDLDARPDVIAARLAEHPRLAPLVAARPGLRVPGAFDPFELAVRAILGQQVSVKAATTLCRRLVEGFGEPSGLEVPGLGRLFPLPEALARAPAQRLIELGLNRARALAIHELASAVARQVVDLSPAAEPAATLESLQALRGIGSWTAHYVAMRGLHWPDAFPSGDLVVRRALGVETARAAERAVEPLRPWRAYAVMHLWAGAASGG